MTLRSSLFTLIAILTLSLAARPQAADYDGPFPSPTACQALDALGGVKWRDEQRSLGGGVWRVSIAGVTPHALGPSRGDVLEVRSARTEGPHVRLLQDKLAICLPTRSDGDVVALLRLLGREVPATLTGDPSPLWQQALARVHALGEASRGLRAGVVRSDASKAAVDVLVWSVGQAKSDMRGKAVLMVDQAAMPIVLRWPPKAEAPAGISVLQLEPGSTFENTIDLDELAKANGKDALLGDGPHVIELVLQPVPVDGEPNLPVRSRMLTLERAAQPAGDR